MSSFLRPSVQFTGGVEVGSTMAVADRPTRFAFAASLLLHGAIAALLLVHAHLSAAGSISEVWGGETLEIDGFAAASDAHGAPPRADAPEPKPVSSPQATTAPTSLAVRDPAPEVAPSERVARPARPVTGAMPASGGEAAPQSGDAGGGESGRTQGTQDADASVRNLAKAFTRAIPFGTRADPIWKTLPLGPAGSMTVVFELGEDGQIVSAKPKEKDVAPALRSLLERTLILLRMGRFAPETSNHPGKEVLRVEAVLGAAAVDSTYGDSDQAMSLTYEAPTRRHPGRAAFQLGNGRRLDVRVTIVEDGATD